MLESEENLVVEEIYQMDLAILTSNSDNINDWALHNSFDWAFDVELVDANMLNDIPELHLGAAVKEHLVHISDRMNYSIQLCIL